MTMRWSAWLKGSAVSVNVPSRTALLKDLRARMSEGRGFRLATLNLDHVVKLRNSPEFLQAYLQHSHITADGNPIVWLSRVAGQPLELLTGSDLVRPIAALAAELGTPVAFFGSSDFALEGASDHLTRHYPDLKIVAQIAPPMGFDPQGAEAQAYVEDLRASGAGVCFVALGAPKQEAFSAFAGAQLPQVGFLSIGAGLDFLAGHQTRAPRLVRRLALEWLWRLGQDPGRLLGRYAACFAILPYLMVRALKTRMSGKVESAS